MIIRGKDRGETGTIKRVIRSQNRVIVEGKNPVKKHIKQGQGHEAPFASTCTTPMQSNPIPSSNTLSFHFRNQ
ncbi:putative ribosomal protein L24 [Helianthus anomalus]